MASFSETLATKYGGVPVWGWMGIGVGLLVVVMFLRSRSAAKQQAAAQQNQPQALQTNLISPDVAASLAQGAAPMAYMGGNLYNNILNQPGGAAPLPPAKAPLYTGNPGFIYNPSMGGQPVQQYVTVGGNQYGVDPLSINGNWVDYATFQKQAIPALNAAGYKFQPGSGDFAATGGFTTAMGVQGKQWLDKQIQPQV
jgi:hypothetical protein